MNKNFKLLLALYVTLAFINIVSLIAIIGFMTLKQKSLMSAEKYINHTENLYETSKNSIVKLYSLGNPSIPATSGTGFKTYLGGDKIITNKHVVENQDIVIAESSSKTWVIKSWVEHPILDIAVLDIEDSDSLGALELDSDDIIRPGQRVYTLGYPLGLGLAIHHGLVSTTDKGKIVFSAPLSEGASGSPLINQQGKVIGICDSYIPNAQNYNLATPISIAFLTKKWNKREAKMDTALEQYVLKMASIKEKIYNKTQKWNEIARKNPKWNPWVEKTMTTRKPTDEAMEHALLAFATIEWGSIVDKSYKDQGLKEAKLLKDCTAKLKNTWEIHKDNLLSCKNLKPPLTNDFYPGHDETETIIGTMEKVSDNLVSFLSLNETSNTNGENKSSDLARKAKLKAVILSIGSFRVAETNYSKIGTP